MTNPRLHILQHALGLDDYGRGESYRNHYVAGDDNVAVCRSLVADGLMYEYRPSVMTGDCPGFSVTMAGRAYVKEFSPKPPKLTRGQRRYRQWLDADSSEPFGEWLKRRSA